MKRIVAVDSDGLYLEDRIVPDDHILSSGEVESAPPPDAGFWQPKWDGSQWVEGLSASEIEARRGPVPPDWDGFEASFEDPANTTYDGLLDLIEAAGFKAADTWERIKTEITLPTRRRGERLEALVNHLVSQIDAAGVVIPDELKSEWNGMMVQFNFPTDCQVPIE